MLIALLLFSSLSYADDMSSEKYCFSSADQSLTAKQKVSAILIPSDTISSDEHCLVIQMRSHRRELIQRFVLSTFPSASISFSSEDVRRDPCKLQIERIKKNDTENINGNLHKNLAVAQTIIENNSAETTLIQTLKDFELTYNQSLIKGSCRLLNPDRYEIEIEIAHVPIPTQALGQIPVADANSTTLKTQLHLSRGEKLEIGGVLKTLKSQSSKIDITPTLKSDMENQIISEKIYLSLQ